MAQQDKMAQHDQMAQQDQKATLIGTNHVTVNAMEGAMNTAAATSKQIQDMVGEIFEMSKQSMEHATQTLDKVRRLHVMDELVKIQTNYVKEAFEIATSHTRRFSEFYSSFPGQITKSYQDAWLHAVNTASQAAQSASRTAADNVRSYSDARKSASAFESRETP